MQLSEFKSILAENLHRSILFVLPTGSKVPPHTHVTEVARIEKCFIDCGGTQRDEITCRLQTWFASDTNHRLTAKKLLAILEKSAAFFKTDALPVEIEHEAPFISQFPVDKIAVEGEQLMICLGIKHTACLAEDKCLPPKLKTSFSFAPFPDFTKTKSG